MKLSWKTIAYIAVVSLCSIGVIFLIADTKIIGGWKSFIFWSVLGIVTESLGIILPSGAAVSVSFAISLAAIIVDGPLIAALVSGAGYAFRIRKIDGDNYSHIFNTPVYKTIFNVSQGIITTGLTGLAFTFVGGIPGKFSLLPTLIAIPVYTLVNSAVLAELLALLNKQHFINIWWNHIKGIVPSLMAVGTLGIIIALAYLSYSYGAVLLFFGPLLLARFSFKLYVDMRNMYIETIQAFNKSMEAKDSYTSGHATRVQEYAVKLAVAAGLPESKVQNIKTAAILHDIGKIGIDDKILKKPMKLTKVEYEEIQRHPSIGAEILKDVAFLSETAEIIKHHHERYDGKGYPDGLKGNEIPIEASILAIADVYDAMTSNRPYREPLCKESALNEIRINAGTQFHPELAFKFLEVMDM